MKRATKYNYNVNPFYVYWKKHYCPKCGTKVELRHEKKIVNSNSAEAKAYDFSIGDTYLIGDVEFRTGYFYCVRCKSSYSFKDMKAFERNKKFL